jgi:REP element-mobilizing transposase RayT
MIHNWISKIPAKFPHVQLENWVIMPNHVHLLLGLLEDGKESIPEIMDWFKTMTTNNYIKGVKDEGWMPFDNSFWQRGYHDRIVRNQGEHQKIAQYISNNPKNWKEDRFYM